MLFFLTFFFQTPIADPNQFNGFLLFGYAATLLIAAVYLAYVYNDRRNVEKDIELMKRLLEDEKEDQD